MRSELDGEMQYIATVFLLFGSSWMSNKHWPEQYMKAGLILSSGRGSLIFRGFHTGWEGLFTPCVVVCTIIRSSAIYL
jgi:hypothetical protein